ncbi:MAG TPA: glycosyltransferase [Patescibacteria group bacterium]|nr:glycosyltransferase [Patescibacteria group bacterium]
MKVALVHDQINEYGGAERVLEALCELYPDAPIYTAFYKKNSLAWKRFKHKKIIPSWAQAIPFFATKLHSPLRFLAPWIWRSFDFSKYDVVISSASWYVTKGFGSKDPTSPFGLRGARPIEICYCHTPPRWLYGYKTSVEWQRFWPVRVYAAIVGHFMRIYDFHASQRVNFFIANSREVAGRIKKFYRRDSTVIYPPVGLPTEARSTKQEVRNRDYYFIVSRIVGAKGLDLAVEAAVKLGIKLKIAGAPAGYYTEYKKLEEQAKGKVEFLGHVSDEELVALYSGAKAFFALAKDEDFGITPVEAMLCGTPVIAYHGGGYKETVIDGKTGVFFHRLTVESLVDAIKKFERMKVSSDACRKQAAKFSKERFKTEIQLFVQKVVKEYNGGDESV